jgi:ABC-2 type transport system ATP-binding protein
MAIGIEVHDLHKSFGREPSGRFTFGQKASHPIHALQGASTTFASGLMHGVIGPEGAGKTTLMRHLVGLLKADRGEIRYFDESPSHQAIPFAEIRESIAYMPQSQSLYPDLSIGEHLDFFRELYRLPRAEYLDKRARLLEITRLEPFIDRPAGKLSGGMYKKLGLMCALLSSPKVLLLDEPTNGVDPISRREFWELLYQLIEEKILILVATAYMDEAERCARVHLMDSGRVIGSGEPQRLLAREGVKNFDEYFMKHTTRVPQTREGEGADGSGPGR